MKQTLIALFLLATLPAMAQTTATPTTTATAGPAASLKDYTGTYTFPDGSPIGKFTVLEKDGVLFGEADGYGSNKLVKQTDTDTYKSTSSYGSIIVFTRDSGSKAVTGLVLKVQGQEIAAKKG